MSYLNMDNVDKVLLGEDIKTVAHNLWTRASGIAGPHGANIKQLDMIFGQLFKATDYLDESYFDAHFRLSPKLKEKIISWVRNLGPSVADVSEVNKNYNISIADARSRNVRRATRGIGKGLLTTATCYKTFNIGNKSACVYFTFDSSKIFDAKVLMKEPDEANYSVKELPQMKSVDPSEYAR